MYVHTDAVSDVLGRVLRELLADGEWKSFGSLAALAVQKTALSESAVNVEISRGVTSGVFVREDARVRLRETPRPTTPTATNRSTP